MSGEHDSQPHLQLILERFKADDLAREKLFDLMRDVSGRLVAVETALKGNICPQPGLCITLQERISRVDAVLHAADVRDATQKGTLRGAIWVASMVGTGIGIVGPFIVKAAWAAFFAASSAAAHATPPPHP